MHDHSPHHEPPTAADAGSPPADHGDHGKHEGHTPEMFRDLLAVSIALTVPILYFSPQIQAWFGYEAITFPGSWAVTPLLATILYFYGGRPFLVGARRELRSRTPGMMTLVAVAITVAYGYSIAVTFGFPGEPFYWELSTLIVVMLLGHWIEMRSIRGASRALDALAELLPTEAHRIEPDGSIVDVPVERLEVGDRILVRPGEQIPADGLVSEGRSSVDEAFLTGESRPVAKEEGDEVVAGAINGEGALTIEVTRVGGETTLSQIMRLVEEAQRSRSRFQVLADRAAFWLTVIALGVAAPTFLVWFGVGAGVTFAVTRMVTVLVIACPHALGLAIPLVTANATSMAASHGVLVRNREAFERGHAVDVVALDKTGTLTEGRFVVSRVGADGVDVDRALALAAAVERSSEHPLASAIVDAAAGRGLEVPTATEVSAVPGRGIRARIDGTVYAVGAPEWAEELGVTVPAALEAELAEADRRGESAVVVMTDTRAVAVIRLADEIRPTAATAVRALRELGVEPVMITGDAEAVARTVAEELGIDRYYARVLPQDKARIVADLAKTGKVAFVGDGINDAPALVTADLGIAIGAGTNVAIESADLVLVDDDPRGVPRALRLARLTRRKMVQNLAWATGYNLVAIPLAAGIGEPAGIVLSPAVGALFMSLSTVIVAVNAMAMRRTNLR
ncbi:MAG TPA: heavy metal translocating P-type ATPase [Actinobacteria bacterium]|nr:heavy metal translocating P-type ATPase [Actinomycetota bacterium]